MKMSKVATRKPTEKEIAQETKKYIGKWIYQGSRTVGRKKDVRLVGRVIEVDVQFSPWSGGFIYSTLLVEYPAEGTTAWVHRFKKSDFVRENGKYVQMLQDSDAVRRALKNNRKYADRIQNELEEAKRRVERLEQELAEANECCDRTESFLSEVVAPEWYDEDGNLIPEEDLEHYDLVG
jgi:hypothetical protein